jgi:molybdate transport system substrate-binding protein
LYSTRFNLRIVTRPGGLIGGVVVDGHADLALQQVPELLAVAGLDYVGLLPEAVQCTFDTACALLCRSTRQDEATRVLDYLGSPAHRALFETKGLEQRSPGA